MDITERLARGDLGLRFVAPESLELLETHGDEGATFLDAAQGLGWQFGFYPLALDLLPGHDELLVRDVERHARALFDTTSRALRLLSGAPADAPLRTEDPAWSPVVEVRRVELAGAAPALAVVHRVAYEPGCEHVMGHLLVPTRAGLVEFRPLAVANVTGYRESALFDAALDARPHAPLEAVGRSLRQRDFDDSRHDATFPEHPLSVVRGALAWLCAYERIEVTATAPDFVLGEVELPWLDCAICPPPRYLLVPSSPRTGGVATFSRVSFAGTDGLQLLRVWRVPDVECADADRATLGQVVAASIGAFCPPNVRVSRAETYLNAGEGDAEAKTEIEYTGGDGAGEEPRRVAIRWRTGAGSVWAFAIEAPGCTPASEASDDAAAAAGSWRRFERHEPRRASRPWWRLWR